MMQGELDELVLFGVLDRGIPNLERVVIHVRDHVDMASFILLQGTLSPGGGAIPTKDSMFWFGNGLLKRDDWIFVYTGSGLARTEKIEGGDADLVMLHWGRTQTMFHTPIVVPILARIDALKLGAPGPENDRLSGAHGSQQGLLPV